MQDWFITPAPWWVILGLGIAGVGIIWKAARWTKEVDLRLNNITDTLNSFMNEIRTDIKRILKQSQPETLSSASPLRLTDLGNSISQVLDASRWAEDTAPMLTQRVEGMVPYDIQEFCRSYVRDEFRPPPELEVKIKECAYQNALDRQSVLDVLMVELRDQLLPS